MSGPDLTADALKRQHATAIHGAGTFKPQGVNEEVAWSYLRTDDGAMYYWRVAQAAAPGMSPSEITARAVSQLRSGRELPRMELLDTHDSLVKIVPAGTSPSRYSPFWVKEAELDAAIKTGKNLSDHFGLPIVSEAPRYDVYRITYRPTRRSMTVPWHHAR